MPDSSDRYQLPSWPPYAISSELWNSVMGSLADRVTAREALEATFEALQATGIQASLDYIQANVAPQIATLQDSIDLAQAQLDQIIIDGISPNSLKLGGQLPAYYATATALTGGLATKVPTTRTVAGKALDANITLAKADVGLGSVDNTADADKPVSTPQAAALATKEASLGFTPVQQGTGVGQGANIVKIGWSGVGLKATVDSLDLGKIWTDDNSVSVLTGSGYSKLPNGLCIQWGSYAGGGDNLNTFPVAFTTVLSVVAAPEGIIVDTTLLSCTVDLISTFNFRTRPRYSNSGTVGLATQGGRWMAIGTLT